ncbi:putative quorum-sensing-regulated virulence factor [Anatilimnocola floriformis]|uniref:putative quorum-sensing-regulated virulence factor n=1 Tax=Anatilimnocola floriformis TaxID=2948575 RepID=UPI0020C4B6EE|nr:DUF3820 family protein [Anatilimnocola floriformis]
MITNCLSFGKYKEVPTEELPVDYLTWLQDQDWLKEPTRSAVNAMLEEPPTEEQEEMMRHSIENRCQTLKGRELLELYSVIQAAYPTYKQNQPRRNVRRG